MHVFFRGPIGIGKSTALLRTIELLQSSTKISSGGFSTYPGKGTDHDIYLSPFGGPYCYEDANRAGKRSDRGATGFPAVFDSLGVDLLTAPYKEGALLCMDELGFMENEAYAFQNSVINCLNGTIPVLGVLKEKRVPWHERIVSHPLVKIIEIDFNTRASAPEEALRYLLNGFDRK